MSLTLKTCPDCGAIQAAKRHACRLTARDTATIPWADGQPHIILRVWGGAIAAIQGLNALCGLVGAVSAFRDGRALDGAVCLGAIGISSIVARLGVGLYQGELQAVYGLCVVAIVAAALAVLVAVSAPLPGLALLALAAVVFGPPIVVGFDTRETLV